MQKKYAELCRFMQNYAISGRIAYHVLSRTGEIRPITTKAFICLTLRTDILSVKGLDFQGFIVVYHPDPDESGVFQLIKEKQTSHNLSHL